MFRKFVVFEYPVPSGPHRCVIHLIRNKCYVYCFFFFINYITDLILYCFDYNYSYILFQEGVTFLFCTTIVFLFIQLFQICGPAIIMQMVYFELEAIKMELHNQLMADRGRVTYLLKWLNYTMCLFICISIWATS